MLLHLRKKHKLVCDDKDQERKRKATNKRKLAANQPIVEGPVAKRVVLTLEIVDSDDEE